MELQQLNHGFVTPVSVNCVGKALVQYMNANLTLGARPGGARTQTFS